MKWIGLLSRVAYLPFSWPTRDSTSSTKCWYSSIPSPRRHTHEDETDCIGLVRSAQEIVDGLEAAQNAFGVIHALD